MYQLKCKAIALASEAQAFKKQEQREKNLLAKWKARAQIGRLKAAARTGQLAGAVEKMSGMSFADVYSVAQRGIHLHRVKDIRKEARNALLAYGFLRGLSYKQMENFSWTQPNWDRVEKLAIRYSCDPKHCPAPKDEQVVKQQFAQWLFEARGDVPPKFVESVVPGTVKDESFDPEWVAFQVARDLGLNIKATG